MRHPTTDPIRLGEFAWVQLLDGGRMIIAPDELPADAAPDVAAYHRRYLATLDLMGFDLVSGGWDGLCIAIAEAER